MPAVVRWPRGLAQPGRTVDGLVSLADFAPTFLELAGAAGAERCDGRSLLPFLRGEQPAAWRDAVFTQLNGVELYYTQRSILTKDWRYVYNGFDFDELYDRQADPHELVNLAFPDIHALPAPHHNRTAAPWPPLTADLEAVRTDLLQRLWRFAHQHDDHLFNPYWTVALAPLGPGSVLGG
ncbi:MAG: sulfatase-like hydrolase/transferase [Fimbriimonadaceae bacterium]|nr:sulfatase-like hydrolase/transferase [Fimbriimonadaceae bacterium]